MVRHLLEAADRYGMERQCESILSRSLDGSSVETTLTLTAAQHLRMFAFSLCRLDYKDDYCRIVCIKGQIVYCELQYVL